MSFGEQVERFVLAVSFGSGWTLVFFQQISNYSFSSMPLALCKGLEKRILMKLDEPCAVL